jgi:hypothetical protein
VSIEELCAAAIVPHLRARDLEATPVRNGRVSVPKLRLDVSATEVKVAADGTSVSVLYEARAAGSAEPGLEVLAVGVGPEREAAAASAAEQWGTGVLPVLESWALGGHVCEVERAPMIVEVAGTKERFGWTVHLGPVLARAYGKPGERHADLGELAREAAFRPVFEVIHPLAAHRELMWVESFACRYFDEGRADATCRLNNAHFDEGRDALVAWASSWPACGAPLLSKRQFLLLEPTPVERLDAGPDIEAALERATAQRSGAAPQTEPAPPWWKRMWRR